MENSRKPPSAKAFSKVRETTPEGQDSHEARELEEGVLAFLRAHALADSRLCVGLSGGMDSMVLLDILSRLRIHLAHVPQAMHVHHGISAHAEQWARFCQDACESRKIPLTVQSIRVERRGGESLEEQARLRRYEAFDNASADAMVLAHHLDDQCETFFLRLLRGSGVTGLGGMAGERLLHRQSSKRVVRPLLAVPREKILAYARLRSLSWIDDDSNADARFARNFLRREILPLIEERFPAYRSALQRAMGNLREAGAWAAARAQSDLQAVRQGPHLMVAGLKEIGEERSLAVLRLQLQEESVRPPPRARLEEVLRQAFLARDDALVAVGVGEGFYRRYRGALSWVRTAAPSRGEIAWSGASCLAVPGGELRFMERQGEGLSQAKLMQAPCVVRFRRGGERMQLAPNRPSRSLKNLFQENAIAPWERDRLPLLLQGEQLAWIARLGYDCRMLAQQGEPGIVIQWVTSSSEIASEG
ncbi:MAG: tRNA lysidine(34) synthetase TilS [Betaproteobacteria bacterium]|nr:tRNA lysidine(34) synthetase TilS [Betaproteobacteria bacterium]